MNGHGVVADRHMRFDDAAAGLLVIIVMHKVVLLLCAALPGSALAQMNMSPCFSTISGPLEKHSAL
jgi:hypothetical protein